MLDVAMVKSERARASLHEGVFWCCDQADEAGRQKERQQGGRQVRRVGDPARGMHAAGCAGEPHACVSPGTGTASPGSSASSGKASCRQCIARILQN